MYGCSSLQMQHTMEEARSGGRMLGAAEGWRWWRRWKDEEGGGGGLTEINWIHFAFSTPTLSQHPSQPAPDDLPAHNVVSLDLLPTPEKQTQGSSNMKPWPSATATAAEFYKEILLCCSYYVFFALFGSEHARTRTNVYGLY